MSRPGRASTAILVVGALLLGVLGSDVAGLPGCQDGCKTPAAAAAAVAPPETPRPPLLGVAPANGSSDLSPLSRVSARAVAGSLTNVSLVDDYGNTVPGTLSAGLGRKFITYTPVACMNRCTVGGRCTLSDVMTV